MKKLLTHSLVVLVASFCLINFAHAQWSLPTATPPNGNPATPVNTGSVAQTKTGDLTLTNLFGTTGLFSNGFGVSGGNFAISTTATSTFAKGINLSGGCFAINNVCIGGSSSGTWVGGSGAASYLPKFTAATTLGNSQVFDTGTFVGIGTTGPAARAHIVNNTDAEPTAIFENDQADSTEKFTSIRFKDPANWYSEIRAVRAGNLAFYVGGGGSPLEALRITAAGDVGIGTGSAALNAKLDVAGSIRMGTYTSSSFLPTCNNNKEGTLAYYRGASRGYFAVCVMDNSCGGGYCWHTVAD